MLTNSINSTSTTKQYEILLFLPYLGISVFVSADHNVPFACVFFFLMTANDIDNEAACMQTCNADSY